MNGQIVAEEPWYRWIHLRDYRPCGIDFSGRAGHGEAERLLK